MTIEDVKTRFLANRAISDPVARQASKEALIADISTEWGEDKVEYVIQVAVSELTR